VCVCVCVCDVCGVLLLFVCVDIILWVCGYFLCVVVVCCDVGVSCYACLCFVGVCACGLAWVSLKNF